MLEASREEMLLMLSNYQILADSQVGMQCTVLPAFVLIGYLTIFCLLTGSSIRVLWSSLVARRIPFML